MLLNKTALADYDQVTSLEKLPLLHKMILSNISSIEALLTVGLLLSFFSQAQE